MIFVDDILTYFRNLGHAAEYGTLAQLNEQLTSVDYSAGTDGMVAFVRLIGEQRTVDGHDQCDIAVHLSWLCPLDFSGEDLLSTQEQAKDTLKTWLQYMRDGNTVTVSTDARWQFGYDDFAENVAWVAVRVTLTASATDCVPFSPEPPTPPPTPSYNYDLFCPQIVRGFNNAAGLPNPVFKSSVNQSIYINFAAPASYSFVYNYALFANDRKITSTGGYGRIEITEAEIENMKTWMQQRGTQMTEETETWLRARIGYYLCTLQLNINGLIPPVNMLIGYSATNYECKEAHNL